MLPQTQVPVERKSRPKGSGRATSAIAIAAMLALSGCGTGGGLEMLGVGTDNSIKTGSIVESGKKKSGTDGVFQSDELTIKNAVSSANLVQLGDQPLSWANADTGSQGAITQLEEFVKQGIRCRRFIASRESFEGISLYKGETCLRDNGIWIMRDFAPLPA